MVCTLSLNKVIIKKQRKLNVENLHGLLIFIANISNLAKSFRYELLKNIHKEKKYT